ncbi:MAG: glucose-1-phosphate cytidylyltransferase [Chloroflexota bacterium]|nr:glucose-1-phosphate cytidylyltransferase [Chloroflexota bacterium]
MQAVILCGGLGARLTEETEIRPKPMVEIGGKPILWHIMKLYSHFGILDFILCLGYKGDIIRDYFLNYGTMNSDVLVHVGARRVEHLEPFHDEARWRVLLAETGALTPTGGRLHRIGRYVKGDEFMATYGDGVADVDLERLLSFHRSQGKLATVTGVRPATRFGELRVHGDLVDEFREKPQLDEGWINGGFFVFRRDALRYLQADSTLEGQPLEQLARDGQLAVFRHDGYWRPMDTMRERRALEQEWASGTPAWKLW